VSTVFVEKLLAAFPARGDSGKTAPAKIRVPPSSYPVESLSDRELEVLRLVAVGLSDKQAAEKLFIAVGTVKRHLNSAYGKLGVHSRTQALARAKELGWL
jgi:ATP/maltotriose-dependent transcriptional regulator MalT